MAADLRPLRLDRFPIGGRTIMAGNPDHQVQDRRPLHRPRRLLQAFSSPDSYGLVLLLILVTYALSATATAGWTVSLVLFVQIATIWVTLQAAQARRRLRQATTACSLFPSGIPALVQHGDRRRLALPGSLHPATRRSRPGRPCSTRVR
jgi:hypothetical protein